MKELFILDKDFKSTFLIDSFRSFIWTDRYQEAGDFEIELSMSSELLDMFVPDFYLYNKKSEHLMIIENRNIKTDLEEGNTIIITGHSLESIIERRIVWSQIIFEEKSLQDAIKQLLDDAIINPSDESRKIDNFIFEYSDDDAIVNSVVTAQLTAGDSIYEFIESECKQRGFGFKVTLNNDNQFVFKLYNGVNRSYSQNVNPYVIFSPKFDNILGSEYLENKQEYKNVGLVGGEGEGDAQKFATATDGSDEITGLNRREVYIQCELSTNNAKVASGDYIEQLKKYGELSLLDYKYEKLLDGELEDGVVFTYGVDYEIGDTVQVEDEYGNSNVAYISELIFSVETTGERMYPTFTTVK